ncbi:hypothetical protein OIO90_003768 [Microbotryomycetes sp. JL221]|nr:hypothetical protein OIO90_003768 [Microbotryomycetes sp. JL221]
MAGEHAAVLPQGAGYAVVLGLGFFFSFLMLGLTWLQNRYSGYKTRSASEFASASHSVKPGLIASGIVSSWTWAATLLQSSAVAYKFGICGPWWYAAGATVQILLFAMNAAKLKLNSPGSHTFLEVIRVRWGKAGHFTMGFFSMATNVIVSSMLMTGGSATVTDLTGMSTPAACMLIPVGVVCYVVIGGMRSSLMADYIHTALLYIIILVFMFTAYATSDKIGSPAKMFEMLKDAALRDPLTMALPPASTAVFLDQAYWQRAIASKPVTSVKAFMLGGSAWLSIPLGFATTMGLSAVVLTTNPSFPGYPEPLSAAQIGAGLPAPSAGVALLGKTGAALVLVVLFLAVTSAASAELIAVSSLVTYDVYLPYINPSATESQVLRCEKLAIVATGLVMGCLGVIFWAAKISMGWLYEFMGTALGSAVVPVALAIMWSKANKWACVIAAWAGLASGLTAWLVTTKTLYGEITISTTFEDYSMLAGNLASIGVGAIVATVGSLLFPDSYDFEETRALHAEEHVHTAKRLEAPVSSPTGTETEDSKEKELQTPETLLKSATPSISDVEDPDYDENKDPRKLKAAFKLAASVSVGLAVVLILCIPLPLFFSSHIFSKADFYVWVVVTFIWVFYGMAAVVLYPAWESRHALANLYKGIVADVRGKKA